MKSSYGVPHDLAPRLHAAWVAFVKGHGPGWRPYTDDSQQVQAIGTCWELLANHRPELRAAWERADH